MIPKRRLHLVVIALAGVLAGGEIAGAEPDDVIVRHHLRVRLDPAEKRIEVVDDVTLPPSLAASRDPLRFRLHRGLAPTASTPGASVEIVGPGEAPLEEFRLKRDSWDAGFTLRYAGVIDHPLEAQEEDYARGFSETLGTIGPEGVVLQRSSGWYPQFGRERVTFTLEVSLPDGWDAVSQGSLTRERVGDGAGIVRWESPEAQDEIHLVAARFHTYERTAGRVKALAYLRTADAALAGRYLEATGRYLAMYQRLLGSYPYSKFALVENFWDTGYGMPSFTLLGPKVIRLPFILSSSYPHEILHNWWGNGVYVDEEHGNWCEGLTAYLADHLFQEQKGAGAEYRQTTLQKYADYVSGEKDFPLTAFRSRHSSATEAVGYGKALMLFHMLRLELGDDAFVKGLRVLYERWRFRRASFGDVRSALEEASGKDLSRLFEDFVARPGAPQLALRNVSTRRDGDRWRLAASLEQVQPDPAPYRLRVPIAVTLEGQTRAFTTSALLQERRLDLDLSLPSRPLRLDLDPEFDLFRRLDRAEVPPALSQAFGAARALIVLPSEASPALLEAYRQLAEEWRRPDPARTEITTDRELAALPRDRSIWILGWENRFVAEAASGLTPYGADASASRLRIGAEPLDRQNRSVAVIVRHPAASDQVLAWVAADLATALPGLGRKLPHYHKYSYLVFEGEEPSNVLKGRWPVVGSPMTAILPAPDGGSATVSAAALPPRQPLVTPPPTFSAEGMMGTIRLLASETMRGRGFGSGELDAAAETIAARFREAGLEPGGDDGESYFQSWTERGGAPERETRLRNVVGILRGSRAEWAGQSVVVGAHYDHLGLGWPDVRAGQEGSVHPGADDNASGVAVLLELARVWGPELRPDRTIVFVAFAGEEAGRLGSRRYVQASRRYPAAQCIGMINLDTVGHLGTGKLLVLGAGSAREWVHVFNGAGYVTGVPVQSVADDFGASDQKSFLDVGVPAIQLFTGPHADYHAPSDTPASIDAEGLTKVASIASEAVLYLASRPEPLTAGSLPAPAGDAAGQGSVTGGRRVSLGTVPDFTHPGPGLRLSGITPGSPAERAGLRAGDVIVRVGATPIPDLRAFSEVLKSLKPGDRIAVTFERDGKPTTVEAEVVER